MLSSHILEHDIFPIFLIFTKCWISKWKKLTISRIIQNTFNIKIFTINTYVFEVCTFVKTFCRVYLYLAIICCVKLLFVYKQFYCEKNFYHKSSRKVLCRLFTTLFFETMDNFLNIWHSACMSYMIWKIYMALKCLKAFALIYEMILINLFQLNTWFSICRHRLISDSNSHNT